VRLLGWLTERDEERRAPKLLNLQPTTTRRGPNFSNLRPTTTAFGGWDPKAVGGWEFVKGTMLDLTPRQLLPDSEDLTGDGGVVKRITTPGIAGGSPTTGPPPPGSVVKVRFVGRAVDTLDCMSGVVFDSSAQRMEGDVPFRLHLGTGTFIAGLELALAGMARGETALLACAAEYAYGARGALPEVAPGATVAYEVTLCTFRPPLVAPGTPLTPEGRMAGAARLKAVGPTASFIWLVPSVTAVPHSTCGVHESMVTLSSHPVS